MIRFAAALLLLGLSSALSACDPSPGPAGAAALPSGPLAVGAQAPNITLTLHDGSTVSLASLTAAKKSVLVYFYPKDDTPGCTTQAKGIRDAYERFEKANVAVFGVSTQGAASHGEFIDKHALPFPLVVDADEQVARAFGVPVRLGFASRQSFLVGPDGRVAAAWHDVDPAEHAEQVLAAASKVGS